MSIFGVGGSQPPNPINPEPTKTGSSDPLDPEIQKQIETLTKEISELSDHLGELNTQASQILDRLDQIADTPDTQEYRNLTAMLNQIFHETSSIHISIGQKTKELAQLYST